MRKLKVFKILMVFLLIVLCAINVYATEEGKNNQTTDENTTLGDTVNEGTEWTDFSNVKIEVLKDTWLNRVSYKLNFKNVNFIQNNLYKVYINNFPTKPNTADITIINGQCTKSIDEYLEKDGDIFIWVVEEKAGEEKTLLEKHKIERPIQNIIGKRITGSFFGKSGTFIFFNEPSKDSSNRNIKIKIGMIDDVNILQQIKDGKDSALKDLLSYAKSANSVVETTLKATATTNSIISASKMVEDEYYYVYMVADDENGTYYPVEDVSLYQYQYIESNGGQLVDYLSDDFKWNISKGNNSTTSTGDGDVTIAPIAKLPNTGITMAFAIISSMLVIYTVICIKKYNKFKGIK